MILRIILLGFLILTASCTERAAVSYAQGVPIDKRYGQARLDSAFELNDPYADFRRPKAAVSATPAAIRERFGKDLEAMFGADSFTKSQLDSGSQILVFNQKLQDGLESFVMHVSDMIAGDQYFLYLKRGDRISPKPWRWYGPAPENGAAPKLSPQGQLTSESGAGSKMLALNEWRHNGNMYSAWIRTLLKTGDDLSLNPEFRFEAIADIPFENRSEVLHRTATYNAATDQYLVRTSVATGSKDAVVGTVTLVRHGQDWKVLSRDLADKRYANMIWSANPEGEDAIWKNAPADGR